MKNKNFFVRNRILKIIVVIGILAISGIVTYGLLSLFQPVIPDEKPPNIIFVQLSLDKRNDSFILLTRISVYDESGIDEIRIEYEYAEYRAVERISMPSKAEYIDEEKLPFDIANLNETGSVRVVARDKYGNEAYKEKHFTFRDLLYKFDKSPPWISEFYIRFLDPHTIEIRFDAVDNTGVINATAKVSLDKKLVKVSLEKNGDTYIGTLNIGPNVNDITVWIYATDLAGRTTMKMRYLTISELPAIFGGGNRNFRQK